MTHPVYKLTGAKRLSALLKYELHTDFCRDAFTLKAGSGSERKIGIGTLLAMTLAASAVGAVVAAGAENTGDGTLTLADPATTSAVKSGDYTVVCTTGGADGTSKFRVEDPEGVHVGTATGGTAFTKQIRFTIAGGAADFVEGDSFKVSATVELGEPTGEVVEWDPDASDGTEQIWGVAMNDVVAPDGIPASSGLALRRGPALLQVGAVSWPDGITDDQKANALAALAAMQIIVR